MKKEPTVAIVYDFDGTLSPMNMQAYDFMGAIGCKPDAFWHETQRIAKEQKANVINVYMKLMIDKSKAARKPFTRQTFKDYGKHIELYPGVMDWFKIINEYGKSQGLSIQHYINSSGLREIIEGTPIAKEFEEIYACSFMYDANNAAEWPAEIVDFTTKTQHLFMINKGISDITENYKINDYVPPQNRPIPFERMIYIGDGATDIPCMRLVKQLGGHSIAVYGRKNNAKQKALQLKIDNRVDYVVKADYSKNSDIYKVVSTVLNKIKADYENSRLKETFAKAIEVKRCHK